MYLRFFHDMTQSEIGAELSLSQVQVSRLLHAALGDAAHLLGGTRIGLMNPDFPSVAMDLPATEGCVRMLRATAAAPSSCCTHPFPHAVER